MKWIVFAVFAFCSYSVSAQNVGDAYYFIKTSYRTIPMQSNQPYYDTTVAVEAGDAQKLTDNVQRFFENSFDSYIVDSDSHTFVGFGTYTFRTTKKESVENTYVVNYSVKVAVAGKGYQLSMQHFSIINQEREINFVESYKSAGRNNGVCNQFLAYFNWHNQKEIKKIGRDLNSIIMPSILTASR
jgi:hypothetical protein